MAKESIYVVLLRGINAGGRRRVPMVELRELFSGLDFTEVRTYINSGNVIFASQTAPTREVVQAAIERKLGFDVDTLIVSGEDFLRIARAIPAEWGNDYDFKEGEKADVVFLFAEVDKPEILAKIGYRPEIETLIYVPGAILSHLLRKNQPQSSLLRLVGTPLYRKMTVRNVTTVRKIAAIVYEMNRF